VKPTLSSLRNTPHGYFLSRFGEPEYTSWLDESLSWKQAASFGDWSFLWQRRITGPEALRLLAAISVNSFANFAIGQAKHVIHCNRDGKVIHEGVVSRLGEQEFMMHGRGGFWAEYNLRRGKFAAHIEADDWFVFQLAGPRCLELRIAETEKHVDELCGRLPAQTCCFVTATNGEIERLHPL